MKISKKAKGIYYLNQKCKKADNELLEFLIRESNNENLNISRCCLHNDEKSLLMSMLIIVRNYYVYPAHKHDWKDESYTIIRWKCEFKEFDDKGILLSSTFLSESDTLLNNNKNFHLLKPLTNVFAFIENTIGPFKKDNLEFLHE